jgi:hypothetical protein
LICRSAVAVREFRHSDLADSILYLCALIAHQPRAIDQYIDYFGETRSIGNVRDVPDRRGEHRPRAAGGGRVGYFVAKQ